MSAPVLTWLFLAQGQFIEHSLFTNHCHAQIHFLPEVSSSFCSAQTSVQGPLHPTLRANLFPKVTDLFCRLPLPTLFYKPEAVNLGDLMRLWVRIGVQIKKRMWLFKDSWRHTRHLERQSALPTQDPCSRQSVFQGATWLKRKENAFQDPPLQGHSWLCHHHLSTSQLGNVSPIAFQSMKQSMCAQTCPTI